MIQGTAVSFCDGGQWRLYDPTCFAYQPTSQQITEKVVIDPTRRQRLRAAKGVRGCMLLMKESFAFPSPCDVSTLLGPRLTSSYPTLKERIYSTLALCFLPHSSSSPLIAVSSLPPTTCLCILPWLYLLYHDIKAKVKASVCVTAIKFQALKKHVQNTECVFFLQTRHD